MGNSQGKKGGRGEVKECQMTTSKWIEKKQGNREEKERGRERKRGKEGGPKHSRAKVYFNFDVVGDTERWPKQMAKYGNRENDKAQEKEKKRRGGRRGDSVQQQQRQRL